MKYTVASLTVVALLSGNAMAKRKPNIILFLVDDMGWQDTSLPFWKEWNGSDKRSKIWNHICDAHDGTDQQCIWQAENIH